MYLIPLIISIFYVEMDIPVPQSTQEKKPVSISQAEEVLDPEGLVLLKKHCYACHNPNTASHDEIIAPPFEGIKSHYFKVYPEKNQFTDAMVSFIQNPQVEKALMKGPVKRFGLMPKPAVSEEDLQKIIVYIQDNKLETPVWWTDHTKGGHE
jgi:hypothetical protein